MPTLQLKLSSPADSRARERLAAALTELSARVLDKRPGVTVVMIECVPSGGWFVGGTAPAQPAAVLEITVTQGTNTAAQKSAFVTQAHRLLNAHLAPGALLDEASYVTVREVLADDWGYGGVSQAERRGQAAAAAAP